MKPPKPFKIYTTKQRGYSPCIACDKWKFGNNIFFHDGILWTLCRFDYADYWENTDELSSDYKGY